MEWGWDELFALISLLLVVEGIMPAISPENWRKTVLKFASFSDNGVRFMGLTSMILGAIILAVVHNWDHITSYFV